MVKINWTDKAINDLEDIGEYISKDSFRYAALMVQRLFDHPQMLINNPHAGRIVPELKKEDIRELIYGNYRIVYRVVTKTHIDILTVHHSARLIKNNPVLRLKKK